MSLIHNERTKLLANALDRASTACVTVGVLAPVAAALYAPSGSVVPIRALLLGAVAWIFAAAVLHMAARYILSRLK
jgi:hypothetical protein